VAATYKVLADPYAHCRVSDVFPVDLAESVLAWFETEAPWARLPGHHAGHGSFDLGSVKTPDEIAPVNSPLLFQSWRESLDGLLALPLGKLLEARAHHATPGEAVGIHNDNDQGTMRFIVHFNRGWSPDSGGYMTLIRSDNPLDLDRRIIPPRHNTGIVLPLGLHSYHAVGDMTRGDRYTIVYTFGDERWRRRCEPLPIPGG